MPDYYEVLAVQPHATIAEIRRAYRRLAMRYHPDRNPGDPLAAEKFKQVTEAYRVLSDPVARQQYDRQRGRWTWGGFTGYETGGRWSPGNSGSGSGGGPGASGGGNGGGTGSGVGTGGGGANGSGGGSGIGTGFTAKGTPALAKLVGYAVGLYLLVQVGAAIAGLAVAVLPYAIVFGAGWFYFRRSLSKK